MHCVSIYTMIFNLRNIIAIKNFKVDKKYQWING